MIKQLDIIERLEDDQMFMDAIDDAIIEILQLRRKVLRAHNLLDSILNSKEVSPSWLALATETLRKDAVRSL